MSTARGLQSAQLARATRAGLPPQSTSARGNNGSAESPVGSQAPGRLLAPTPRRASDSRPHGRPPAASSGTHFPGAAAGRAEPGDRFGVDLFISLFKSKTCPGVGVMGVVLPVQRVRSQRPPSGLYTFFGQEEGRIGLIRILQQPKTESLRERLGPSGPSLRPLREGAPLLDYTCLSFFPVPYSSSFGVLV